MKMEEEIIIKTFLTNFSNIILPICKKTISEYKSQGGLLNFWIEDNAYDSNDDILENYSSLHSDCWEVIADTSAFWAIYDKVSSRYPHSWSNFYTYPITFNEWKALNENK